MKFKSTSSNEIGIQFKVWCPAFNRVTHRLFLLGSLPELGAWNIDDALEAYSTTDLHIWKVEAAIPPMSRFEWVWLKTSHDRSTMEWERQVKRNMEVDCFSGTLHTIWGDNQEVFLQSATCVELTTFMRVDEGYTMVLTGSTVTTGLWDIAQAVSAHEFPKRSGYWKAQVAFDAFSHLDFKWAVVKEKDSSHVRVKEKLSHSIYGRRAWIRAVAPWMMPMVVVVDTPALSDFSDNMLGRSDVIVNERKRRLEEIKTWLTESGKLPVPPRPSSTLTLATKPAEPEKVVVKSSSLTPSSLSLSSNLQSATRKPSVQRSQNLQDLQKSKPGLSRTERLTKQLNKDFKDEVYVLKGVGSIRTPTDLLNADITNQVPILDGGLALLQFSAETEESALESSKAETSESAQRSAQTASTSSEPGQSSTLHVAELWEPKPITVHHKGKKTDSLVKKLDEVRRKFSEIGENETEEREGIPIIEKNVENLSSFPPPTFSMMQEENIESTLNPVLVPHKKKPKVVRVAWSPTAKQEPMTLFEKFKLKTQEKSLAEAVSIKRGPFTPSPGGPSNENLPSGVGYEDTSKTASDIKDEQVNRRLWDKMRDNANKDR